ncbi:MAG: carboxypeptidase regulatory-like domain-containing protein [bacterium]
MRLRWLTAALCILPALLSAQAIRGTVVRPGSDVGISGVVVLLIDANGQVVARSLTNERGEYRVAASVAGVYRIRTLRIGFRPATTDAMPLSAGKELMHQLSLSSVPFALDTVRVVDASVCRVRADTAAATYAIWEQVRTALTATQISAADRTLGATVVTYDRTLDADGRRVRTQTSKLNKSFGARPWVAQPKEELRRLGYVVDVADGGKMYYAPDLDILLSDEFLDDHCFRIARDRENNRFGLAFEPARNRREVPEIRGTIWLDKRTSELDRLEFRYANVTRAQEDGQAGGEMAFVRMANGAWAISRWSIHMPALAQRLTGGFGGAPKTMEVHVVEIKIGGGELALMTRGRDTIWSRPPLVLSGVVSDSLSGRAVTGARVALLGTALKGVTDAEGRFAIAGVLPGEYAVEVRTASLDAVGAVHQSALLFTDGIEPLRVRVPVAQQVMELLCPARRTLQEGFVVGSVTLRGDTVPQKNVKVFAAWTEFGYDVAPTGGKPNRSAAARTDSAGRFRLCGIPLGKAFTVSVTDDNLAGEPLTIQVADGLLGRADLVVDRVLANGATFTGTVLTDSTREPIANVDVVLPDLSRSERTNERGQFRFIRIPEGTQRVTARRVGYGPLDTQIAIVANQTLDRRIYLSRVVTLDSVKTVATRERFGIGLAGFEERRRLGFGKFLGTEMLRKNEHRRLPDVLRALSGVSIYTPPQCKGRGCESPPLNMQIAYNTKERCYFQVILDGVVVAKGGNSPPSWQREFDLNAELLSTIEAIEVYRGFGEVPLGYGSANTKCGVILLWSRKP